MISVFNSIFQEQLRDWIVDNKRIAIKIMDIVKATSQDPYTGIGKPERLKHERSGLWSRRIDQQHRMVYEVDEETNTVLFLSCYGHYD
jgi:toxin YoeB